MHHNHVQDSLSIFTSFGTYLFYCDWHCKPLWSTMPSNSNIKYRREEHHYVEEAECKEHEECKQAQALSDVATERALEQHNSRLNLFREYTSDVTKV